VQKWKDIVQDRERCEMAIGKGWICSDGATDSNRIVNASKEEGEYIFIN